MEIYLARSQGFCSGVSQAINAVDKALSEFELPIYVYHEIVHNTFIVNDFVKKGVIFVDDINDIPDNNVVIFSAHGVPPSILEKAKIKKLHIIDATCPLVKKVHNQAVDLSKKDYHTVLIGHKGHQEIIGTSGYVKPELLHIVENEKDIDHLTLPNDARVGYVTQTTLSVDEAQKLIKKLKERFANLYNPNHSDICFATQDRQDAIKELAMKCDVIIVCGSPNSSNSNRLRETGERCGISSYIVDNADDLNLSILKNKRKIGLSSGASVPRLILDKVIEKILKEFPNTKIII